ncbi:MAG: GNAT family N-acetyltransferase [Hyphomicrobiales bacterium]|nr:MAG: GNAT family N-acetyltransferase [Hyphomicrobiales bacterium]
MSDIVFTIRPELPSDDAAVDALHDEAFGPGRFARTAFRLREGVPHDRALSFSATIDDDIVGSVWLTPILIGEAPALLLGPLTVSPTVKHIGIGRALMRTVMSAAAEAGHGLVLLVGDEPYYGVFGFKPVAPGTVMLPGPVDPKRLLLAELKGGASIAARGMARSVR